MLRVHFGKAEAAYRRPQTSKPWPCLSMLFQLRYLNELCGECNGTARTCMNTEYQALYSTITEHAWEHV